MPAEVRSILLTSGSAPGPSLPFTPSPDPNQLPGFGVIQHLTNGFEAWALIAALIGLLLGAVMWAFGHYSQNYQQAYSGRRGVMVSALAALLIGGAPEIINFFTQHGSGIH